MGDLIEFITIIAVGFLVSVLALYGGINIICETFDFATNNKVEYVIENEKGITGHIYLTGKDGLLYFEYPEDVYIGKIPTKDSIVYKIDNQFKLKCGGILNEGTKIIIYVNGKEVYRATSVIGKLKFKFKTIVLKKGRNAWIHEELVYNTLDRQ